MRSKLREDADKKKDQDIDPYMSQTQTQID